MGYSKLIQYGNTVELYQYERNIQFSGRKKSTVSVRDSRKNMVKAFGTGKIQEKQIKEKRPDNARRSAMVFKRLVSANLGQFDKPVLASFTYREDTYSLGQGYKDFSAFVQRSRNLFGDSFRYVAVPEFQKSGRLHFHALFWGLPVDTARQERHTRLVASLWGLGFVDLIETDGSLKLATYLSKYMSKGFMDSRMGNKKSFRASRNIIRPVVYKNCLTSPFFYSESGVKPDLSTVEPVHDKRFDTQWLGKGRFRLFELKD